MIKKLVIVAGVLLVGGWLLARTDLGSYTKTAWSHVKGSVKNTVPVTFEIKRAKDMIASLDKEADKLICTMAEQQVDKERLEADTIKCQAFLEQEEREIKAANEQLKTNKTMFVSGSARVSRDRFALDLERRFQAYRLHEAALKSRKQTLNMHHETLNAARANLDALKAAKEDLQARLDKLETELQIVQAEEARAKRASKYDDSRLAKIKNLVDDIEKQVNVRRVEVQLRENHKVPAPTPAVTSSGTDITVRIDGHFEEATASSKSDE